MENFSTVVIAISAGIQAIATAVLIWITREYAKSTAVSAEQTRLIAISAQIQAHAPLAFKGTNSGAVLENLVKSLAREYPLPPPPTHS